MLTKKQALNLIARAKDNMRADAEIMKSRPNGCPRNAWRDENGIDLVRTDIEGNSATIDFSNPYFLRVWDNRGGVLKNIDLREVS